MTQQQKQTTLSVAITYTTLLGLLSFAFYVGVECNQNKSEHTLINTNLDNEIKAQVSETARSIKTDAELKIQLQDFSLEQKVMGNDIAHIKKSVDEIKRKL